MPGTKLDAGLQELQTQMKQVGLRVEDSLQASLLLCGWLSSGCASFIDMIASQH